VAEDLNVGRLAAGERLRQREASFFAWRRAGGILTVKLEALRDGEWRPHQYGNAFIREATTGPDRLRIGPRDGHASLMLHLAADLAAPYKILYVLHTPRGGSAPGRYQSPAMDRTEVESFFLRFGEFFAGDGRHDIWLRSGPDAATLVWDRHDLMYAYGPLDRFGVVLERVGLRSGEAPAIPSPHSHRYHPEWDDAERELVAALDWVVTPLRPGDEQ
jgi:hypothetical protein